MPQSTASSSTTRSPESGAGRPRSGSGVAYFHEQVRAERDGGQPDWGRAVHHGVGDQTMSLLTRCLDIVGTARWQSRRSHAVGNPPGLPAPCNRAPCRVVAALRVSPYGPYHPRTPTQPATTSDFGFGDGASLANDSRRHRHLCQSLSRQPAVVRSLYPAHAVEYLKSAGFGR